MGVEAVTLWCRVGSAGGRQCYHAGDMSECFTCLSVKPPSPTDDCSPREDDLSNLSAAEVQSWSESFERLMSSLSGRRVFREFLRCEYSEENILFPYFHQERSVWTPEFEK